MTWQHETYVNKYGTGACVTCGEPFTEVNPCCCDDGCNEAGNLHLDGHCRRCCAPNHVGDAQHTFLMNTAHLG